MKKKMKHLQRSLALTLVALLLPGSVLASSHMDAPLITLDPAANTTDVYAFVQNENGVKTLVTALGVYPFEEPGIGPNKYNFDDDVVYEIHVATGDDLAAGRATFSYQFKFTTTFKNRNTILQSYLDVVQDVDDANQNLTQTYTVTKVEHRGRGRSTILGTGKVPPNNQGNATPFYNQGDNGENPAKEGVATADQLDKYTRQTIAQLSGGYVAFAGQRDDGFYADIQAVFDLLKIRNPGKDSQGGFNLHLLALAIPVSDIGGDMQVVGVYGTTSRQRTRVLREFGPDKTKGDFVQVARQGNPLFNEGLVAIADKDLYSRTSPVQDRDLFAKYASNPELATLLNRLVFKSQVAPETNRSDLVGIFIPDLIKVDLSTGPARLAGGSAVNPDDPGFSRLSIFGDDVLVSQIQTGFGGGVIPGGWPNGRRFGDDVLDIAVTAVASDLRTSPPTIRGPFGDNLDRNDMVFNKVFPYESTPQNGRTHAHHR